MLGLDMKKHVLFGHQAVTLKASPVPTAHELHLSEYFSLYKNKKSTQVQKGQNNQKQPEFKANLSRHVHVSSGTKESKINLLIGERRKDNSLSTNNEKNNM